MKKNLLIFVFIFFTGFYVSAENLDLGDVKGAVIDKNGKEPLGYVTVSVFGKDGKTPIKTVMTDDKGRFDVSINFGVYLLKITYLGYQPLEIPFTLNKDKPNLNLSVLEMLEVPKRLGEVTVVGERAQMRLDIDKKVFDVDKNIASAGGSATDVLENIPSVNVDGEGNISLRNNENVTVFINGKPSGLTEDNRAQILQQMPAETIQQIEIITNPSAKYNPEGSAGIINIVLKENRKAGYFGGVQTGADSFGGFQLSGNINYNSGKWESYANLGYRNMMMKRGGFSNRTNNPDTPSQSYLNQTTEGENKGHGLFFRAGTTYHLTQKDHIGLSGFGMFGNRAGSSEIKYKNTTDLNIVTNWKRTRSSDSDDSNKGGSIVLDYQRDFGKDHNLKSSISFNTWNMDGTTDYSQITDYVSPTNREASRQTLVNDLKLENWEVQIDYSNKLSNNKKIEAGYKGTLSGYKSLMSGRDGFPGSQVENRNLYNDCTYDSNIQALYATFSNRIDKFGYQLGLRGEYTDITTDSRDYDGNSNPNNYADSYFKLFPSLFLSYTLPHKNELQLNYTRRINRPRGFDLNPFKNISDSTLITMGNPELNPVFTNAYEFTWLKNWDYHTLSTTAYYRTSEGVIQRINYMENSIMYSKPINVSESQSLGVELLLKNRFFNALDLTTTANLYYYKLDSASVSPDNGITRINIPDREDFSWNIRMIAGLMLKGGFSLQVTGNYNAAQVIAQGTMGDNYSMDAGIRKSFFNRKLNVAFNVRDVLDSRKRRIQTQGAGFYQDAENWFGGRRFSLTLTYSFGNMMGKNRRPQQQQQDYNGSEDDMNGGMEM